MNLGTTLRDLRKKKGMTQVAVAKKLKMTQAHVSKIESGESKPNTETLEKLSTLYGLTPQIVLYMSMKEGDVPKKNRKLFQQLKPIMDDMIEQLIAK
jgi:XRE family transcriptional regulator, regulator of sulfur utilization